MSEVVRNNHTHACRSIDWQVFFSAGARGTLPEGRPLLWGQLGGSHPHSHLLPPSAHKSCPRQWNKLKKQLWGETSNLQTSWWTPLQYWGDQTPQHCLPGWPVGPKGGRISAPLLKGAAVCVWVCVNDSLNYTSYWSERFTSISNPTVLMVQTETLICTNCWWAPWTWSRQSRGDSEPRCPVQCYFDEILNIL